MNNESAIEFYKKFGFNIVETKEQYYKRIEPADAHVLEKFLKEDQQTDHSKISNGVGEVGIYQSYKYTLYFSYKHQKNMNPGWAERELDFCGWLHPSSGK